MDGKAGTATLNRLYSADQAVSSTSLREGDEGQAVRDLQRALKELGLDAESYLYRERPAEEIFPWERLDMGFHKEYLYAELQRAKKLLPTVPCFPGCRRCGVC